MKSSPAVDLTKICQWLEAAAVDVVETMFGCLAYAEGAPDLSNFSKWQPPFLRSEISFSGDLNMKIRVWIREDCATELTSRVLQMPKQELNEAVVDDTVGEMSNMILGSVKSKVVDRGMACTLSMPQVVRGVEVGGFGVTPDSERFLQFRFGSGELLIAVVRLP